MELEDFPRVIDIYCEQSGRSLKFTSKQDPPWQESRISGKIGRKAVGSIFHLHLQSHNKRYSDITAQSHVIGQENKVSRFDINIIIRPSYRLSLSDVGVR